jgi:hypothetical protein
MVRLTRAEMAFFKREGYLVVRGAMDKELCAAARDRLWETSESGVLQRDAPSTWLGPLPESDLSRDAMNARGEYRWQWRGGGAEDLLLDLLPRTCLEIAEQLLGEGTLLGLRPAGAEPTAEELEPEPVLAGKTPGAEIGTKCRGIYCTLPASLSTKPRSLNANACHTDGHPMSLGLVGLILVAVHSRCGRGATSACSTSSSGSTAAATRQGPMISRQSTKLSWPRSGRTLFRLTVPERRECTAQPATSSSYCKPPAALSRGRA